MKLFIDANGYLNFLRLSKDQTSALDQLLKLVKTKKIELVFPLITREEYLRNRETEVLKTRKGIESLNPPSLSLPSPVREKSKILKKKHADYCTQIKKLEEKYLFSVESIKKKIDDLYSVALHPDENEMMHQAALRRRDRGNPPGKPTGPIGDQLAWELLLANFTSDTLTIISIDGDWFSVVGDKKVLRASIVEEWNRRSQKTISYKETVGEFVNGFTKKPSVSQEKINEEKNVAQASSFSGISNSNGVFTIDPRSGYITLSNLTNSSAISGISSNVSFGSPIASSNFGAFSQAGSVILSPAMLSTGLICENCKQYRLQCICLKS